MNSSRRISLTIFVGLLLVMAGPGVAPALSQGIDQPQPPSQDVNPSLLTFQTTLDELGYGEARLESPHDIAEYTLRLPEGWELREGSFLELDFSYTYRNMALTEDQVLPSFFGDIVVVLDGETQDTYSIGQTALKRSRLRVDLSPELLNSSDDNQHTIEVILRAGHICRVSHQAQLTIHSSSLLSLSYEQLPATVDLGRYPRPFYQRAFEADRVYFVLPAQPSQKDLAGGVAVAAKLGDLTYNGTVISGTTDLELLDRLGALEADETLPEHLVVIGKPTANEVILRLNRLGALPVPLKERRLTLASQGPAAVTPGDVLTYTLRVANTTDGALSSLTLFDALPDYAQMVSCTPACSDVTEEGVSWTVPSLGVGAVLTRTLALRLGEVLTDSVIENTITVFDAASSPLNVNTLTTTVQSTSPQQSGHRSSTSADDGYFFWQEGRPIPENDGVVQELISPWNQTRAILVITGLSDDAVYKACQAMSFESRFPGMRGAFALVRRVSPKPETSPAATLATDLTFADLGYGDRVVSALSHATSYYFDIPPHWQLTEDLTLNLYFSHSPLLDYEFSYLSVSLNRQPVATIPLSDETAVDGELSIDLPASQARRGDSNRITIESVLEPYDRCVSLDIWLLIRNTSRLHFSHTEQDAQPIDLDFYPYPFTRRRDLADVLFLLPVEPRVEEWAAALRMASSLGHATDAPDLRPAISSGTLPSDAVLTDHHLIALGRPTRNTVLQRINAQLPQPFRPGFDTIEQRMDEVVFRLPSDYSLGLVQLLQSPWNEDRAFLAVTGTTDEGVGWAANAVANRSWALEYNVAFVEEEEIKTVDTQRLTSSGMATAVATAVPEMSSATTATVTPTALPSPGPTSGLSTSSSPDRPSWLIPLVAGNVVLIAGILGVAFWRARRRSL